MTTVFSEMKSASAISRLVRPVAARRSTSASRSLNPAGRIGFDSRCHGRGFRPDSHIVNGRAGTVQPDWAGRLMCLLGAKESESPSFLNQTRTLSSVTGVKLLNSLWDEALFALHKGPKL